MAHVPSLEEERDITDVDPVNDRDTCSPGFASVGNKQNQREIEGKYPKIPNKRHGEKRASKKKKKRESASALCLTQNRKGKIPTVVGTCIPDKRARER